MSQAETPALNGRFVVGAPSLPPFPENVTVRSGHPEDFDSPYREPRHRGFRAALLRLFCGHTAITMATIGTAIVGDGTVFLPAVEVRCSRCGEFWHAELDASEAVSAGLEA